MADSHISDDTVINGVKWKILKHMAMNEEYRNDVFFVSMTQLISHLVDQTFLFSAVQIERNW